MMLIPFRDPTGLIQACQIRFMAASDGKHSRYVWLSTPEAGGGICGTPLHFAGCKSDDLTRPLLVTEGALKAETVTVFEHGLDIIGSPGVSCSHGRIVSSARLRQMLLGFDGDNLENRHVARSIASLIHFRLLDQEKCLYSSSVRILSWERKAKGIDDAFLQNLPISRISPRDWYDALSRACRQEVERYFESNGSSFKLALSRALT